MSDAYSPRETVSPHQPEEPDDIGSGVGSAIGAGAGSYRAKASASAATRGEGLGIEESRGDFQGAEETGYLESVAGDHDEVSSGGGAEMDEEYAEATAEQLEAESTEKSAFDDLRSIAGAETVLSEEAGAVSEAAPSALPDAGAGTEAGQQEFFPALAALAPMLVSAVGPALARAVKRKLSPRARRVLSKSRLPGTAISVVKKLLETAEQQPLGEAAMDETEAEALVGQAVQVLEVIIGTDDRVRIAQTNKLPWYRICALRIEMKSGANYRGTGFLIGERVVATAGHCVNLHNQGGWARKIEVIPGCNGAQRPFGSAFSVSLRSVKGWTRDRKPDCDYGCIVLSRNAFGGKNLGNFGADILPNAQLLAKPVMIAGYDGDKPFAELWGMSRRLKAATSTRLIYDVDTWGGKSGAPVYITSQGKRIVVGIHNYGAASGNSATRVTAPVMSNLKKWSELGQPARAAMPRAA